jgi:hypothetical protein
MRPKRFLTLMLIMFGSLPLEVFAGGAQGAGSVAMTRVDIIDHNGFERPMVSGTLLVPRGWSTRGGVQWKVGVGCNGGGFNVDFGAAAPDGSAGFAILPIEDWAWSSMGSVGGAGCRIARISSVRDYLADLVERRRPGARILDFRERPDIAAPLAQLAQDTPMPMGRMRTWVEGGEVLVAYQANGIDMRESISTAVSFSLMQMDGMMGMPGTEVLTASTLPGFAMRAPAGQLDFQLAETIRTSNEVNPEWQRRMNQHNAAIAGIQLQGARERSRITAETGESILDMQMDTWRRSNESSDYLAREGSEAIRGVETYNDPINGGTVELDNQYNNAWQLDDGRYILTNDAGFNPYQTFGQGGQQLEVTK